MLHSIPTEKLGPLGPSMAAAVQACVHCGFCLAACPTYSVLGQEMDTPRGRIVLVKQVLEGELPKEAAAAHINRCLGCLACEPACPSGVSYRHLINPFRALTRTQDSGGHTSRVRSLVQSRILPYPDRFRIAARLGLLARRFKFLSHLGMGPMLRLLPRTMPRARRLPHTIAARGERRSRVALLTGCVQQVLDPDINEATIEVLSRNGVEVVIPPSQTCCGGLAWHTGELASAQDFARRNLDAFPEDVDAVVTNAAGCGSTMQEYSLILKGTKDEGRAENFSRRVVDAAVFLSRLGLRTPGSLPAPLKAAYQDACHLAHAQNVQSEPRALLRTVVGLDLVELSDPSLCCGSAGTYNLDQPEIAAQLGQRKARAVVASGAAIVISGNIGCMTQLRTQLAELGSLIQVRHTMQVLRDACSQIKADL